MKKLWVVVLLLLFIMPHTFTVVAEAKETDDGALTMTLQQLQEYHKQLDGYSFHTVVKATFITKDSIGSNVDGKSHFFDDFSFEFMDQNPKKLVKADEEVEIVGLLDGNSYTDCHIVSTGNKARSVQRDIVKNEKSLQEKIDAVCKRIAEDKGAGDRNKIKKRKYITIAADELYEYCEKYDGYAFHSVMKITEVKDSSIYATSYNKDKTLFYLNFDGKGDLRNAYSKGELIEVEGLIDDIWIGSVSYNSCCIIARGDGAIDALKALEGISVEKAADKTSVEENDQKKPEAVKPRQETTKKDSDNVANNERAESLEDDNVQDDSILKENEWVADISQGAKGNEVKEVQSMLIALGFLSSTADGSYGPITKQAVEDFQKEVGLDVTGIVDKSTYDILLSDEAPKKKETEPAFKIIARGDAGEDVVNVQHRLIELRFLSGVADGKFGGMTEQAVKDFQNADNLNVTGIVDETTYNSLMSSNAPQKETNAPETTSPAEAGVQRFSGAGTVYWTPNGEVYHLSSRCRTLSRSRTIYSGTVAESGKSRACSVCG